MEGTYLGIGLGVENFFSSEDDDGEFFEDTDRSGFWRNVDSFEGIPLATGQTVTGISFDLVPLAPIDEDAPPPETDVGLPCTTSADCPPASTLISSSPRTRGCGKWISGVDRRLSQL